MMNPQKIQRQNTRLNSSPPLYGAWSGGFFSGPHLYRFGSHHSCQSFVFSSSRKLFLEQHLEALRARQSQYTVHRTATSVKPLPDETLGPGIHVDVL